MAIQHPNTRTKYNINHANRCYDWMLYTQQKSMTFEYCFHKAFVIANALIEAGWDVKIPMRHEIGTVEGWESHIEIIDTLREYYEATGDTIDVMLNKELIGYEGCKVRAMREDGVIEKFTVGRWGKYAPYHIKSARKGGTRVKCKYISVELV